MNIVSGKYWDAFILRHPNTHILQSSHWGEFKSHYGWNPMYVLADDSGAQVLFRQLPLGYTIAYIPKGPIGENWHSILETSLDLCRKQKTIVLYVEPDCWEDEHRINLAEIKGFTPSNISIQPRRTIIISLKGTEESWLQRMKQKTRYNIRLAEKKGIVVEQSKDIGIFNQLIKKTSERDEFNIHEPQYYERVFRIFTEMNQCELLVAYYENIPLAALIIFYSGTRAWYFYGASNNKEKNRMPTYLLQWQAIRNAAARGCEIYDLWGIPDDDIQYLEKNFSSRSDGLWGVYRFKRGFGGEIKRTAGVFQYIFDRKLFVIYQTMLNLRKREIL